MTGSRSLRRITVRRLRRFASWPYKPDLRERRELLMVAKDMDNLAAELVR